jgi:carboxyl-terminal processing protease
VSDISNSPPRRRFPPLLLLLMAFAAGVFTDRFGRAPARDNLPPSRGGKAFAPFQEAWDKVHKHYVDRGRVDDKTMTEGAIRGMLASLGDTAHTTYLTKEDRECLEEEEEGRFQGIGATLAMRDNHPTILQTEPISPARSAGLKRGDVLVEVDGNPVEGQSLSRVIAKLRGRAGSEVKLKVRRMGQAASVTLNVKRARVEVPDIVWQVLPGPPVAHLAIRNFGKNTPQELRKALNEMHRKDVKRIILDVRGNPGGLKNQAIAVTGEFLKKGQVVFIEQGAGGMQEKRLAESDGKAADIPLCVLINAGTASAAEVLAGALQDHRRARLVGTSTSGTGTVLREYSLSNGGALLLGVRKWLTPHGRQIWHKGISPDKGLTLPLPAGVNPHFPDSEAKLTAEQFAKEPDVQLRKAYKVLTKELR